MIAANVPAVMWVRSPQVARLRRAAANTIVATRCEVVRSVEMWGLLRERPPGFPNTLGATLGLAWLLSVGQVAERDLGGRDRPDRAADRRHQRPPGVQPDDPGLPMYPEETDDRPARRLGLRPEDIKQSKRPGRSVRPPDVAIAKAAGTSHARRRWRYRCGNSSLA